MDTGLKPLTCPACGATYARYCADGLEYFHVCAPLSEAELVQRGHGVSGVIPPQVLRDGHRDERPVVDRNRHPEDRQNHAPIERVHAPGPARARE